MKKFFLCLICVIVGLNAYAQSKPEKIVGRPFDQFSTTAFCSYKRFHPSQYIVDNNWDILCAFRIPGAMSMLDSLNISYNKSQLQLLVVGDLLSFTNGKLKTEMCIFDKTQTEAIRRESKAFADSIFPYIEPKIKKLTKVFNAKGYNAQTYSLIFSYLLDGYIWADGKLPSSNQMADHGTWSGAY